MTVKDRMKNQVISVGVGETVAVAARTLTHYNIGALPVCGADGRLCGMVTDRDLVTRCVAPGKDAANTRIRDVMTRQVVCVDAGASLEEARLLLNRHGIQRLPVILGGKLCGIVSRNDLETDI